MEPKDLLRMAFDGNHVPGNITYCFHDQCPMKDQCIHYLCGVYKSERVDRGFSVFPNALRDGKCQYFAALRIVKVAWGFDLLFEDVKAKDAPGLRAKMKAYLGSNGQYSRYKLGRLRLLPEQQAYIKQMFADKGYQDVEFDHFIDEIDFSKC